MRTPQILKITSADQIYSRPFTEGGPEVVGHDAVDGCNYECSDLTDAEAHARIVALLNGGNDVYLATKWTIGDGFYYKPKANDLPQIMASAGSLNAGDLD